jgi:hypothetical protein
MVWALQTIATKQQNINYQMKTNKLKRYELEVRELKRLINDSWLNEKSEYHLRMEGEKEFAEQMLQELQKLKQYEGPIAGAQAVVNVEAFQPVHAWIFHFTQMQDIERSLHMDACEEFIRLTQEGVTLVKVPIDL